MEISNEKWYQLQNELRDLRKQVATMSKIAKERANRDRNLHPVKDRCGYIFVSSTSKWITDNNNRELVWFTTLQTPFEIDCPANIVIKQFEWDLKDGLFRLTWLGIREYDELTVHANAKTRYWCITLRHTESTAICNPDLIPIFDNKDSRRK